METKNATPLPLPNTTQNALRENPCILSYLFSTTNEHPILPNLITVAEDYTSFNGTEYTSVQTTYNTSDNLPTAWANIQAYLQSAKDANYLGDDDYYNVIPDMLNQYLQLAAQISHEEFNLAFEQIQEDSYLTEKYGDELDDMLDCSDYILELIGSYNW